MAIQNGKFLQLPQGTEGIHLEEALRHRRITRKLNDLFTSWGFLPVKTPVFDFFDNYRELITPPVEENIYRLMDREGDLLMLRSDVTLFLARQMGMLLKKQDLPIRVSYSDTILRHQHKEDISKNEFFQTGVELIGVEGYQGDMEILLLLEKTLLTLNRPAYLHLGSRSLFRDIVPAEKETQELLDALKSRDRSALSLALSPLVAPGHGDFFAELLLFIGSSDGFEELLEKGKNKLSEEILVQGRYLLKLTSELKKLGSDQEIRIDLSEIGSQPYHSGIVFQVYMEGIDSAVVSGGRYDKLLENFGLSAPSVGFSLLLRKIEALLPLGEELSVITADSQGKSEEESFAQKFTKAETLRKEGRIVTL